MLDRTDGNEPVMLAIRERFVDARSSKALMAMEDADSVDDKCPSHLVRFGDERPIPAHFP